MKIRNLKRDGARGWMWNIEGRAGVYYTTRNGEGIFYEENGNRRQVAGLSQFEACETASGMRRKLRRLFNDD